MKYKINIQGMDCKGCKALINMALEENEFTNIEVNQDENYAVFESTQNLDEVKNKLDKAFPELPHHSYSDLNIIK